MPLFNHNKIEDCSLLSCVPSLSFIMAAFSYFTVYKSTDIDKNVRRSRALIGQKKQLFIHSHFLAFIRETGQNVRAFLNLFK